MSLAFLHSPAQILRQVMVDNGLGSMPVVGQSSQSAWPVYNDQEPNLPDNCLTLYDTSPKSDGRTMVDGEQIMKWAFQLRVRSQDVNVGWAKLQVVKVALDETVYQQLANIQNIAPVALYNVINVSTKDPLRLGKDGSNSRRSLFTLNGFLTIMRVN